MMPYHAARGGRGVAGAQRVSVVMVRPAGAPVLWLAWPPQLPGMGICVSGWVGSGALVVSPSLVPEGQAVLPPVASGLWRAWLAVAAASGPAWPLVLDGVEPGLPYLDVPERVYPGGWCRPAPETLPTVSDGRPCSSCGPPCSP